MIVLSSAVADHGQHAVAERRGRGGARAHGGAGESGDREHGTGQQPARNASPAVGTAGSHQVLL